MFAENKTPVEPRAGLNDTNAPAFVYVLIPGSERTYRLCARLKRVGLRWTPAARSWSGPIPVEVIPQIEAEGLHILRSIPIERAPEDAAQEFNAHPPRRRLRG